MPCESELACKLYVCFHPMCGSALSSASVSRDKLHSYRCYYSKTERDNDIKLNVVIQMLVIAPSAGRCRVSSHLKSTSLWLGQQVASQVSMVSMAQSVGWWLVYHPQDLEVWKTWHCLHKGLVELCEMPGGLQLYPMHTESHIAPDTSWACSTHTSCVHTHLSLWSSAAIQHCSAILLCRVINYSLRISALVQSWDW